MGEGQTSRDTIIKGKNTSEIVAALHENTMSSARIIGFSNVYFENLPDNRFDKVELLDIIKLVEKYIREIKPNAIYTHHAYDLNIDHRITCEAVLTATRPIGNYPVKEIYEFETLSSTEWNFGHKEYGFCPNVFINIEGYFETKIAAMKQYQSELCLFPHPRSLDMLEYVAKRWGGTVGLDYAEAFELIRRVE